jgi:hypothetical protein
VTFDGLIAKLENILLAIFFQKPDEMHHAPRGGFIFVGFFIKLLVVWPKNTIFAVYSKKFRKFPILLKTGIRTPHPMGILRRTLQKCLLKIFCENRISGRKTRFSRKSDRIFAKFPRLNCKNRILRIITAKNTLCK